MIWRLWGTFYLPSLSLASENIWRPRRKTGRTSEEIGVFSLEIQLNFDKAAPRLRWLCDS